MQRDKWDESMLLLPLTVPIAFRQARVPRRQIFSTICSDLCRSRLDAERHDGSQRER